MGSGASSNVQPISIGAQGPAERVESSSQSGCRPRTSGSSTAISRPPSADGSRSASKLPNDSQESQKLYVQLCECRAALETAKDKSQKAEKQVKCLEKQVSDLESERLDLQETISSLQENIDKLHAESLTKTENKCENTLNAKNCTIQQLEKETQNVQTEITKLRNKFKKKLRTANAQLVEAKHLSSLKVFEMKEEINRLLEENSRLMGQQSAKQAEEKKGPVVQDTGRTTIILELSERVSEQESIIQKLKQQLAEKDESLAQQKCNGSSPGKASPTKSARKTPRKESGPGSSPRKDYHGSLEQLSSRNNSRTAGKDRLEGKMEGRKACHGSMESLSFRNISRAPSKDSLFEAEERADSTTIEMVSPRRRPSLMTAKENDDTMLELKAIAKEMKKIKRKKSKKSKRSPEQREHEHRESSGVSRDSGVISMETEPDAADPASRSHRPISATSTISALSLNSIADESDSSRRDKKRHQRHSSWSTSDDDDDADNDKQKQMNLQYLESIRQISAPRRKAKNSQSEFDYIDALLSGQGEGSNPTTPKSFTPAAAQTIKVVSKPPPGQRSPRCKSPRSPYGSLSNLSSVENPLPTVF